MKLGLLLKEIDGLSLLSKYKQQTKLIAVSKQKSAQEVLTIYEQGQRDFGENYADELLEKATQLPKDIRWHFIGHLQSNKARSLAKLPNLYAIHSIVNTKTCSKLNSVLSEAQRQIDVFIQLKLSDEETKSGIDPNEINPTIEFILKNCPQLIFKGFMTIGKPGDTTVFDRMMTCKLKTEEIFKEMKIELSMGMSADYKPAIFAGANYVRIGSLLFGERDYPQIHNKPKDSENELK